MTSTLARGLLASQFIYGGFQAAAEPGHRPQLLERAGVPPSAAEGLVRLNVGAMVVGGVAMTIGLLPRVAAGGLAAALMPTTLVGHAFWAEDDPAARRAQRIHFWKNVTMLGGLLVEAGP